MSVVSEKLAIDKHTKNSEAIGFCNKFLQKNIPRYIFGRNQWGKSIAEAIDVDGFIDDFTSDSQFAGKPIVPIGDIPKEALVVSSVVLGRPLSSQKRIIEKGLRGLDYFSFKKYSGLHLDQVLFLDSFADEFDVNRERYEWVYGILSDSESKQVLQSLLNFRLSHDLTYMEGFTDAQYRQYFEEFLGLGDGTEIFLDVGCFDGYTSLEFIRRYPEYKEIHVFEPDPNNMSKVRSRLAQYPAVIYHQFGCSNRAQILRLSSQGSSSKVSENGDCEIQVARIDDLVTSPYTFLKMDIEGYELQALEGACGSIKNHHPVLAISVYHKIDDIWRIPELILNIRSDYNVYLRHYTEGVTETVMFFVPV
jgi:FkbM family methyltransferase